MAGRLSDVERKSLLTWVIVGGGPTGSELAAEMHDLARSKEFNKRYPKLAPQVQIKLMDAAPAILTTFDESLSKYAAKKFKRDVRESGFAVHIMEVLETKLRLPQGIDVLTSRRVLRVEHNKIVTEQDGESESSLACSYMRMAIDIHSF